MNSSYLTSMGTTQPSMPRVQLTPPKVCGSLLSVTSSLALFIIASLGIAGIIPGSTMGWCAIGLGLAGGVSMSLMSGGNLKDKKFLLLTSFIVGAAFTVMIGALGVTGVMSGVQVGWAFVGLAIASLGLACCAFPCCAAVAIAAQRR